MSKRGRWLFAAAGFALGLYASVRWFSTLQSLLGWEAVRQVPSLVFGGVLLGGGLLGGLVGFLFGVAVLNDIFQMIHWLEGRATRIPGQDMAAGALGAIVGLIIAILLVPALSHIPLIGSYLPAVASLVLGYLGWVVAIKKREDLGSLFQGLFRRTRDREEKQSPKDGSQYKILDTSVIIDGRIADLCRTGFIEGTLVVPAFVLDELRHIADSSDALKRNRGRRGLDILNAIQKELRIPVRIEERELSPGAEVDSALVQLAKELGGKVVTNDFNLNKVAEFQGVPVLNINELANAVKPAVLPGEEMTVQIIKDGKEAGQGVAYLDDGTMVVVDGGKRYIGLSIGVEVTSVLQTSAGRMIFAKPKGTPVEGPHSSASGA